MHKPARQKFPSNNVGDLWEIDLHKWFTWNIIYRYVDVLDKFVTAKNLMDRWDGPSKVSQNDVLRVWVMKKRQERIRITLSIYFVGQKAKIRKEMMK